MIDLPGIFILLLLPSVVLADNTSNAVNERIPVTATEMEAHWNVNCAAVQESLLAAATQPGSKNDCGISAKLRQDIQLCAFIYQAPGNKIQHKCPDYNGVSEHLQQANKPSECSGLLTQILGKVDCRDKTL
jgi:hypothetical protein